MSRSAERMTCPVCDRRFDEGDELERHAESRHDVLREFIDA